jgi:fructose-1,6-bisphosphatase I
MSPAPRLGMRLHRFLFESEQQFPQATGELSALLSQLGLAGKRISRLLSAAGLIDVLGVSGKVNVQGEQQQKLDALANEIFLDAFAWGQLVPTVVTEEMELPAHLPENVQAGKYIVFLDPLDGSSNLDVNGAVGSIFSVRLLTRTGPIGSEDDLMKSISKEQVVAGYFSYGPSTTLVYTAAGNPGVHVFTLDPGIGEFLLSAPDVRIPDHGPYYGANEGGIQEWGEGPRRFVEWAQKRDAATGRPYSTRYSGALVTDFHRILLKGGIYLYPGTRKNPDGKIRLMYEAAPLAAVAEAAGGAASDGQRRILDVVPDRNHQRTPIFIGSTADVARVASFVSEAASPDAATR